ncbi:hypothetical protein COT60_00400 [Candidatus Pacearchaeota archaeon CG09_land_8_20_14_0_10_30_9]|nr:hypothetical protein [Candidatus Aenigmarchaeota archaeon]PIO01452.1 MAG: hypothetical protein COT60_00400 [Candidatus Pacearchaeota archaeon CG09_land_8_20_14_0_10_30_9]PJA71177.1 MAG: hypothetical protein CO153_02940 [Candidatus Pacearchaeota archaeon CG_4_9_14_3_um_filter_30_11]
MEYKKNYENFGNKKYEYNRDNFRIRSPVKTFRDLEVYQVTIKLSNLLANLDFLKDEKDEIKQISEKIPKLIAESYGDKFDSFEIAEEKLNETMTLITNVITKIDLLREKFCEDKERKEILDNVLTKYGYQKLRVLNLKNAWKKVFGKEEK